MAFLKKCMLITVQGADRPGITHLVMEQVAKYPYELLDIGQAVTQGLLSLSLLITPTAEESSDDSLLKNLLFESKKWGLSFDFKWVEPALSAHNNQLGAKYILSCVSNEAISAKFLRDLSQELSKRQINILRLDNLGHAFHAMEIRIQALPGVEVQEVELMRELMKLGQSYCMDLALLRDNIFRSNKRLIVFDMDSTLIEEEVIDELARLHGVEKEVKEITVRAMSGQMNFDESLCRRVALLKGLEVSSMQKVLEELHFTPGTEQFVQIMKRLGMKLAVITGGFTFFAEYVKNRLGLHYAFANELEVSDGRLSGRVRLPIINAEKKAFLLEKLAEEEQIQLEQVVAIGDGANDLLMLSKAGMGIAFHAKEVVRRQAGQQIGHGAMTSALTFLGMSEWDLKQIEPSPDSANQVPIRFQDLFIMRNMLK